MEIFNRHFFEIFEKHVPLIEVKLKTQSKPWFTRELNQKLKIRKRLYEKYKAVSSNDGVIKMEKRGEYRKKCSEIKNEINFNKRKRLKNALSRARTNKQK